MAVTIDWGAKVILVPQDFLTHLGGVRYELDTNLLRLALRDLEDGEDGMPFPLTHNHNTELLLGGVLYARAFEIINGYTIQFEETGSPYSVKLSGSNNNIADVTLLGTVQILSNNAAGLITVVSGSGVTAQDKADIISGVWTRALEGLTAEEIMRVMLAALAGRRAGLGTATEQYMAQDGVTPRITLTPDTAGNGTPTVDGGL